MPVRGMKLYLRVESVLAIWLVTGLVLVRGGRSLESSMKTSCVDGREHYGR